MNIIKFNWNKFTWRRYSWFNYRSWVSYSRNQMTGRSAHQEGRSVLFNDTLNTFYLRLHGVGHMVKDHLDSERGNPLPPHGLLFLISSKGRGALAWTRNSSMGPPHEGSIRRSIAPWANALTTELHLAPSLNCRLYNSYQYSLHHLRITVREKTTNLYSSRPGWRHVFRRRLETTVSVAKYEPRLL